VRFISTKEEFGRPDLLIIPGSKNTIEDLNAIRNSGLEQMIIDYSNYGKILAICGGYQMLGKQINDPKGIESNLKTIAGIGLLDTVTTIESEKVMTRVEGEIKLSGYNAKVYGYEIHMGRTEVSKQLKTLLEVHHENGNEVHKLDGVANPQETIFGTYLHGILDSTEFRQQLLTKIRQEKGLPQKNSPIYEGFREQELNKLADIVRKAIDIDKIYEIMGIR
jgi:adenosylcobyric acid synthase